MPVKTQKTVKNFFQSQWILLIALVTVILLIIAFGRAYYRNYQINQEIARLHEEAARLDTKKITTLEVLKFVQSPAFEEKKARVELNLVYPGENVAIIRPSSKADFEKVGQNLQKMVKSGRLGNVYKWWNYFFAKD